MAHHRSTSSFAEFHLAAHIVPHDTIRAMRSVLIAALLFAGTASFAQSPADLAHQQAPELLSTYKQLHQAPELSHHEEKTSAFLAAELRKLGYEVTEHVGKYSDGSRAYGIVAILKNGDGPRLLIRTDMDALPVEEKTGLPYASKVRSTNAQGADVAVMHACGHDMHMTVLLGTAREMAQLKNQWHGTLVLIGQPSEETVDGARAMLADSFFQRFGRPDFVLAEHDSNSFASGDIGITGGPLLASSTSIDVTMRGIGGHGSAPNVGKDPIVMAAEFIMQLQTVVSRQINPRNAAVITVGQIHGGTKRNIIPDEVYMGLTMRTYDEDTRLAMIEAVKRIAQGVAVGYGIAADRMPIVKVDEAEVTPATMNDEAFAERLRKAAVASLGAAHVQKAEPIMGSEDFGLFRDQNKIPGAMWWLGVADPTKLAESKKPGGPQLPSAHSALFAPVPDPALQTGVIGMTAMALDVLHK
jgi:hippurate hydrolase